MSVNVPAAQLAGAPNAIRRLDHHDLAAIAAIHLKAFPGSAFSLLGSPLVKRYYRWLLSDSHEAVALGCFKDDVLAGFCFGGVFKDATSGFLRNNKIYLAARILIRPWVLLHPFFRGRIALALRILKKYPAKRIAKCPANGEKPFTILSLAVDPAHQKRGHGAALMAETEKIAREKGFTLMRLTVKTNNQNAVAFYQRCGWTKTRATTGQWDGAMEKRLLHDEPR